MRSGLPAGDSVVIIEAHNALRPSERLLAASQAGEDGMTTAGVRVGVPVNTSSPPRREAARRTP
jgi:hypothetical protein